MNKMLSVCPEFVQTPFEPLERTLNSVRHNSCLQIMEGVRLVDRVTSP